MDGIDFDRVVDTHNHLQESDPFESSRLFSDSKVRTSVVMGTRFSDWQRVTLLAKECGNKVIPAFGVHPWFCLETAIPDSEEPTLNKDHPKWGDLESSLSETPHALVGEIGLDGVAKDRTTGIKFPFSLQLELFAFQLGLAARYKRPCSIHVVQCHGRFFDLIRSMSPTSLPPRMALHSFTGSPDIAKGMYRLSNGVGRRIYFGFSSLISGRSGKVEERIKACPDDRILIESDLFDPRVIDSAISNVVKIVAAAKGWTVEDTVERTFRNAEEFVTGSRGVWTAEIGRAEYQEGN